MQTTTAECLALQNFLKGKIFATDVKNCSWGLFRGQNTWILHQNYLSTYPKSTQSTPSKITLTVKFFCCIVSLYTIDTKLCLQSITLPLLASFFKRRFVIYKDLALILNLLKVYIFFMGWRCWSLFEIFCNSSSLQMATAVVFMYKKFSQLKKWERFNISTIYKK